jgi:diguanylate cyclase (GGDEF)-like protein
VSVTVAPTLGLNSSNEDAAALFHAQPGLHALAVVDGQRPVAILSRAGFLNEYTKPYYREIWGKKSCMKNANDKPRLIERDHNVDELVGILTSEDQRYLTEGFIVVDNGRYVGLGTGDQLVRSVTEVRIEAARHANPLTFLPGNIPISQHIERLLDSGTEFVACYADLNNFKPFNDQYGYWRGDEMIRLVAKLALTHCDPLCDFVGHVGGDDFILLYQSSNWKDQCESLVRTFGAHALELFDDKALADGGITAEDRHGVTRFFPCTTLSIGAVTIRPNEFSSAEQVASMAALAKHDAKCMGAGLFVREALALSEVQ